MSYVFNLPVRENQKLKCIVDLVKKDDKLHSFWRCSNVMAIERMGYTDDGPTHVKIVANLSLKILRILIGKQVKPSIVKNYGMKNEDAEVVVTLASILHDLGMIVTRNNHQMYSCLVALEFIQKYTRPLYSEEEQAIICSEVLHSIASHERPNKPLTVEAGIVGVADALDMEAGRARIPFHSGKIDIHAVSALSIEKVDLIEDDKKPITIKITMSNSAGVFQIDELPNQELRTQDFKNTSMFQPR